MVHKLHNGGLSIVAFYEILLEYQRTKCRVWGLVSSISSLVSTVHRLANGISNKATKKRVMGMGIELLDTSDIRFWWLPAS